jgi:hydroxylaminobenzene mutase
LSTQERSRRILIHGMAFVLAGLVWGLAVPHTPYPRLALAAHVQFFVNGMLFILTGVLLLSLPHRVGSTSVSVLWVSVLLTWLMALSEVANSWWGANQILPIAAHQAGATGAAPWQELIVTSAHMGAGLVLLVGWALLVWGFVHSPPDLREEVRAARFTR